VELPLAALSDKDRADLEFVAELGVDWLALSFVQRPADVEEARNLINIYAALSEQSVDQVLAEVGGQQFGAFKPLLAELAVEKLAPISSEMARLMAQPDEIDRILARGAEQAREITAPILKKTYEIIGMVG
jgi:tryptophanyl-tRNA synthetase